MTMTGETEARILRELVRRDVQRAEEELEHAKKAAEAATIRYLNADVALGKAKATEADVLARQSVS